MEGNRGKGKEGISKEEESLVSIVKWEGRDLEGTELEEFDGYFL